jgi:transcriptional regulator with XRE-family HTH domain
MQANNPAVVAILKRLRALRERKGLTTAGMDERMILGPGWTSRFESGQTAPSLDILLAMLHEAGAKPVDLFGGLPEFDGPGSVVERQIFATPDGDDLILNFRYAEHDARYRLAGASSEEFEAVLKVLRDGLARLATPGGGPAEAIKTDSVVKFFLRAASTWPLANPSDLWWFLVYRAYCDPFNHPASFARLDFTQSWKRTGGWALEEVLVRHYAPQLAKRGINLFIGQGERKERLLKALKLKSRLEADKVDVLLTVGAGADERCIGVVHVKASFAERRTDDVPLSQALIGAGYISPLWTMDCKSMPSVGPVNRGELGACLTNGADDRSAKRKDIEDDGYFSACFSYNRNTRPTPPGQGAKARVHVCDFQTPDDDFSRFIADWWTAHRNQPPFAG